MTAPNPRKQAASLAAFGTVLILLEFVLPLHFRGNGRFGSFFPPTSYGVRLTIGVFLVACGSIAPPMAGLLFLWSRRELVAAGLFVAACVFELTQAIAQPFIALPRLQPFIAAGLLALSALAFLMAAMVLLNGEQSRAIGEALPAPPPPT